MSDETEQHDSPAEQPGDVGQWLRDKREAGGLSQDAVAAALHLDRAVVDALEREDFAAIGATVFVKGHLRAVAQHLGLDVKEAAARYAASAGAAAQAPPELIVKYNRPLRRVGGKLWWAAAALVALIVLLLVWVFWPGGPEAAPSADEAEQSISEVGNNGADAQSMAVETEAAVEAPATGGNEFSAMLDNARAAAGQSVAVPVRAAAAEATPAASAAAERGLRLTFNGECWYEVRDANGNRIATGTARAGLSRLVSGTRPLSVTLGVADAVTLVVDGEPLPIAAADRRGRAARLTIR